MKNKNKSLLLTSCILATIFMVAFRLSINIQNVVIPSVVDESRETLDKLVSDWCRVRRERVDWVQMLKPCEKNMSWWHKTWNKNERTNAEKSVIISKDIKPTGDYSKFFIQSRTSDSRNKMTGGDSWRVKIKGKASISPTVLDLRNGQYEVIFMPIEPGRYNAEIYLDYSLCDGFRDPPDDWFIRGNAQGKHQPEGILGQLDDYLLQAFQGGRPVEFDVPAAMTSVPQPRHVNNSCKSNKCGEAEGELPCSCKFLWDGYGAWQNETWRQLIPEFIPPLSVRTRAPRFFSSSTIHRPMNNRSENRRKRIGSLIRPHFRDLTKGKGTLWSYGDSLNFNLYRYNFVPSPLCQKMFQQCRYNINFVYHIKYRIELDTKETDTLDFNATRVLDHFRSVLLSPDVNHVNSVIFLNLGLHYVMSLTFERYQEFIRQVIGVIHETGVQGTGKSVRKFRGHVIWKTTSSINKQNAKELQATKWRFCTYPRVKLFNAYATSAMCKAGIEVVDMFPITDSYPEGTYDVVHYRPPASQPLVPLLVEHLRDPKEPAFMVQTETI